MGLASDVLKNVWKAILPWSVAHPMEGKLVAMSESVYNVVGFRKRFKKGDIVFGRVIRDGKQYPVIYAIKEVHRMQIDPTMDIAWDLRLLGGYGPQKLDMRYMNPYYPHGEDPRLTHEWYFRDTEMDAWRPKLNYYAEKIVRGGKTIWDVDQKLREA